MECHPWVSDLQCAWQSSSNARTFCDVFSVLLAVFSLLRQDLAPPLLDLRTVSCVAPALVEYKAPYAAPAPAMGPVFCGGRLQ